jgi:NAD(P)-dependent dehydrogenase (short-subunit alcohol dehydrogenase family)
MEINVAGDTDRRAIVMASVSDRAELPVAMVTGTSRGIGAATARLLAHRGYRLALMSRSGCQNLAAELGAWSFEGSLTEESDVKSFVEGITAQYGRLDAVVISSGRYASILNNLEITTALSICTAGFGFDPEFKPDLFAITREAWHEALDLLVLGTVSTANFATPHLLASGGLRAKAPVPARSCALSPSWLHASLLRPIRCVGHTHELRASRTAGERCTQF